MSDLVDKIARAVLYEGYILYPYRPSVKSQQRWTFGGLYPQAWSDAQHGSDPSFMQTECLVTSQAAAVVRVTVRFLHLINRTVGEVLEPLTTMPTTGEPAYRMVESLTIDDKQFYPWQEATEREVATGEFNLADLLAQPIEAKFAFPPSRMIEPLRSADGAIAGLLIREQQAVEGTTEFSATKLAAGVYQLRVTVRNTAPMPRANHASRDEALMHTLVSTHAILSVRDGQFISMTDPPAELKDFAADCKNIGNWPVLVGVEPDRGTVLASPIILYDYPQIAPESPGDLFDALEIDEILSLRIMTLTDEEKRNIAGVDDKARGLLARTESLAREQLMGLHGTMRGMQPVPQE